MEDISQKSSTTFVVPVSLNTKGTNFFSTDPIIKELKISSPRILQLGSQHSSHFANVYGNSTDFMDFMITNPRIIAAAMTASSGNGIDPNSINYRRAGGPLAEFLANNPVLGLLALIMTIAGVVYNGWLKIKEIEEEKAKKVFLFYKELYDICEKNKLIKESALDIQDQLPEDSTWKKEYKTIKLVKVNSKDNTSPEQFFLILERADKLETVGRLDIDPEEEKKENTWTHWFKDNLSLLAKFLVTCFNHLNTAFGMTCMLYWGLWYIINSITLKGAFLTSTYGVYLGSGALLSALSFAVGFGIPLAIGLAYLSLVLFNWNKKYFPPTSKSENKMWSWVDYLFYKDISPFKASWKNLLFHVMTGGVFYFLRYPLGLLFVVPMTVVNGMKYLKRKYLKWKSVQKSSALPQGNQSLLNTNPEEEIIRQKEADDKVANDALNMLGFLRHELDYEVIKNQIASTDSSNLSSHEDEEKKEPIKTESKKVEEVELKDQNLSVAPLERDKALGLDCLNPKWWQLALIGIGAFLVPAVSAHNGAQFNLWYSLDFASAVGHPHNEIWSATGLGLVVIGFSVLMGLLNLKKVKEVFSKDQTTKKTLDIQGTTNRIYKASKALENQLKTAQEREPKAKNKIPAELQRRVKALLPSHKVTVGEVIYYIFMGWMAAQSAIFVWRVISYISGGLVLVGFILTPAAAALVPWLIGAVVGAVFFSIIKVAYMILCTRRCRAQAILNNPEQYLRDLAKAEEVLKLYVSVNEKAPSKKPNEEAGVAETDEDIPPDEASSCELAPLPPNVEETPPTSPTSPILISGSLASIFGEKKVVDFYAKQEVSKEELPPFIGAQATP